MSQPRRPPHHNRRSRSSKHTCQVSESSPLNPQDSEPNLPAMKPIPMLIQLGQALIVQTGSIPGANKICLPLPLITCLTTASATVCGSMTAIPERSICDRWGAIIAVDAHVGCTQVSLTSGALKPLFLLRSSALRPSWKARAEALVMQ